MTEPAPTVTLAAPGATTTAASPGTTAAAAPGATTAAAAPPSQSPVDAAWDGIVPEIAALALERRVNESRPSHDVGRIETAEGAWVISEPSPENVDQFSVIGDVLGAYGRDYVDLDEYAEILLLDPDTGEIVKAYPFPTFTPHSLGLFDDDVYCIGYSEGYDDSMLCRIDRQTLQAAVRVFPEGPAIDPDDYDWIPDNWAVDVSGRAPRALEGSGASPDGIDPVTLEVYDEFWTKAEEERHVEGFLAALADGAYEQAALSAEGLDTAADRLRRDESGAGRRSDETTAEYLARMCDGGRCAGPYEVEAAGPGVVARGGAGSTVTVVHTESGETGAIRLEAPEGRITVLDLPPLVESDGGPTLVDSLFGKEIPQNVVVQRYGAFEVWESGRREWVTNRYADDAREVERTIVGVLGDYRTMEMFAVKLRDDRTRYSMGCGRLATRGAEVLVLDADWCRGGHRLAAEVISGEARDRPAAPDLEVEVLWEWYDERGGTAIQGVGDHEGNIFELTALDGTDLLGDGYAGITRLSVDGGRLAYVDHSRTGFLFRSPNLVVVDTKSGEVVGRWTLDGMITCLELAEEWVVACEAKDDGLLLQQDALVAINIATGQINRVKTRARIFLP